MFSDRTNWKLTRNSLTETLEEVRCGKAHVLDLTISNPTQPGFITTSRLFFNRWLPLAHWTTTLNRRVCRSRAALWRVTIRPFTGFLTLILSG